MLFPSGGCVGQQEPKRARGLIQMYYTTMFEKTKGGWCWGDSCRCCSFTVLVGCTSNNLKSNVSVWIKNASHLFALCLPMNDIKSNLVKATGNHCQNVNWWWCFCLCLCTCLSVTKLYRKTPDQFKWHLQKPIMGCTSAAT